MKMQPKHKCLDSVFFKGAALDYQSLFNSINVKIRNKLKNFLYLLYPSFVNIKFINSLFDINGAWIQETKVTIEIISLFYSWILT